MSDDWSLKGKGKDLCVDDYGDPTLEKWETAWGGSPSVYEFDDIQILREKLIEDVDVIDCTDNSKLKKWEIIEEVLNIIEKRFGKDETDVSSEPDQRVGHGVEE